jgi:hypothetical protein
MAVRSIVFNLPPIILLILLMICFPAFSENDDLDSLLEGFEDDIKEAEENRDKEGTDTKDTIKKPNFFIDFSGEHLFSFHMPVIKDYMNYSGELKRPVWKNILGLSIENQFINLHSYWELNVKLGKGVEYDEIAKILPQENYLSLSLKFTKLSFGFQRIAWGTADGLNPTDNINPWDYSLGPDMEALPVLTLRLVVYPADFMSMDFVCVPYRQESVFPYDVEDKIVHSGAFTSDEVSTDNLSFNLLAIIAGIRLSFYFPVIDFSFSYLYDFDPYFTPKVEVVAYTYDKSMELEHRRIHRIGFDLKGIAGQVGLWLETCFSLTEDPYMNNPAIRNPNLAWTFGGDINFGPDDRFYINIQYNGKYIFKYYRDFYSDYPDGEPTSIDPAYLERYYSRAFSGSLAGETEGLINNFILKSDFNFKHDTIILSFVTMYSLPLLYDKQEKTRYGSLYLNPSLQFKIINVLEISIGSNLFFAWQKPKSGSLEQDENDKIGMFHKDSNIYLSLEYIWSWRSGK